MVEGHSLDVFLADKFRTDSSDFYSIWNFFRGFTAPIFLFTTGAVFIYFIEQSKNKNERIKKGISRGFILILIGYLLKFPTHKVFLFEDVVLSQWKTFFAVDALQIIGIGLIFLAIVASLNGSGRRRIVLAGFSILILGLSPFVYSIDWNSHFNVFFSAYFSKKIGSHFQLFPWLFYLFSGGLFGSWIYQKRKTFGRVEFIWLFIIAILMIVLSYLIPKFAATFETANYFYSDNLFLVFERSGVVLLLSLGIIYLSNFIQKMPDALGMITKKSLQIYVFHLILLYGCAWFPGVNKYIGRSFNLIESILLTIFVFVIVFIFVNISDKLKTSNLNRSFRKEGILDEKI